VVDRQDYARYHYQEAMGLLSEFSAKHLTKKPLIAVVFGGDNDARWEFETLMTKLGAHTIACIQSIHAIPDIVAHSFYYSLGLNLDTDPLKERTISAKTVEKRLRRDPRFLVLAEVLSELTTQGKSAYLAALSKSQ
jgi:hypothetical protein